jgi:hypothetical protein
VRVSQTDAHSTTLLHRQHYRCAGAAFQTDARPLAQDSAPPRPSLRLGAKKQKRRSPKALKPSCNSTLRSGAYAPPRRSLALCLASHRREKAKAPKPKTLDAVVQLDAAQRRLRAAATKPCSMPRFASARKSKSAEAQTP